MTKHQMLSARFTDLNIVLSKKKRSKKNHKILVMLKIVTINAYIFFTREDAHIVYSSVLIIVRKAKNNTYIPLLSVDLGAL